MEMFSKDADKPSSNQKWQIWILTFLATLFSHQLPAQLVTTVAGTVETPGDTDGQATKDALFRNPHGIAVDKFGRVYVADRWNHKIRVLDTRTDSVYTLAGTGVIGTDDGPGDQARFHSPWGVACDSLGTVYVADTKNQLIRRIDTLGNVTTYAGSGSFGVIDGPSTSARFADPTGITISPNGNLFVCDHVAHTIRKITPSGIVSTIAGQAFVEGDVDGAGSQARFNRPYGIELNRDGDILVADEWNHKIRKVSPNGFSSTIAGSGLLGSDDGTASNSRFNYPWDVVEGENGAIYVMDGFNHIIRRIESGMVETWVGTSGETGGQDGFGSNASFSGATAICYNPKTEYLYIGDAFNDLIRRVEISTGVNLSSTTHVEGDTACLGETIRFTAAPEFYQSYDFILNGSSVQNGSTNTYETTLNTTGSFEMTVSAVHQDGYTVSSSPFEIEVVSPPSSDFSYSLDSEGPSGYFVSFTSLSTAAIAWEWNFGDPLSGTANTSFQENPTHLYSEEGVYDVQLITTGAGECKDTLFRERFIAFLGLSSSPLELQTEDTVCLGQSLTFTSSANIYNRYLFYQNDQLVQNGTGLSYQNTFNSAGDQSIYIVGIDANGDSTFSPPITFYVAAFPTADFTSMVGEQNQEGFAVSFSYTGLNAREWKWDFGDPPSGANNQSGLQNPTHVYAETGSYDVQLIVVGEGACADTVLEVDAVSLIGLNSSPIALQANDTLCIGETVEFTASPDIFETYTFLVNGQIQQQSTSTSFIHSFSQVGTDDIQVIGENTGGQSANSSILPIQVVAYPEIDISFQILGQIAQGFEVEFSAQGTGAREYFWEFGDPISGTNNVSTIAQPIHVYQQDGLYDVRLITTGAGGCRDTVFKSDFVILLDVLASTISRNDTVCVGHSCVFSTNTEVFDTYTFFVNDLQVQESPSPDYETTFNNSGTYEVWIIGTQTDGKTVQSAPFSFFVSELPMMDFVIEEERLDRSGLSIQFQSNATNVQSYLWLFDVTDSSKFSTEPNPVYTYPEFGSYSVTLIGNAGGNCRDTLTKTDFVRFEDKPSHLFVPTAFTPNGDGVNDVLYLRGQNIVEMSFTVFNEWGEAIYQSKAPDQGWDGTYQGSLVPADTYIYAARVILANGQTEELKGQTTVIR